jgi:hypothetical protein
MASRAGVVIVVVVVVVAGQIAVLAQRSRGSCRASGAGPRVDAGALVSLGVSQGGEKGHRGLAAMASLAALAASAAPIGNCVDLSLLCRINTT